MLYGSVSLSVLPEHKSGLLPAYEVKVKPTNSQLIKTLDMWTWGKSLPGIFVEFPYRNVVRPIVLVHRICNKFHVSNLATVTHVKPSHPGHCAALSTQGVTSMEHVRVMQLYFGLHFLVEYLTSWVVDDSDHHKYSQSPDIPACHARDGVAGSLVLAGIHGWSLGPKLDWTPTPTHHPHPPTLLRGDLKSWTPPFINPAPDNKWGLWICSSVARKLLRFWFEMVTYVCEIPIFDYNSLICHICRVYTSPDVRGSIQSWHTVRIRPLEGSTFMPVMIYRTY